MQFTIKDIIIECPGSQSELTIITWIAFMDEYGNALDDRLKDVATIEDVDIQAIERTELFIDRCYALTAFFADMKLADAETSFTIQDVTKLYNECFHLYYIGYVPGLIQFEWDGCTWYLPPAELQPNGKITFGEFVDSKVVTQSVKMQGQSKYHLLQMISAIFLRKEGEAYTESLIDESGPRMTLFEDLPISIANAVGGWFEQFNTFIEDNFTVFQPSHSRSGSNMKAHYQQWGWVNFLKREAERKIYDIPNSGLNSIECARMASAYDVLVFASEEKSYNEAYVADMNI